MIAKHKISYLAAVYRRNVEGADGELVNVYVNEDRSTDIEYYDAVPLTSEEQADISNITVALQALLM
jgi:hypothetical protein